MLIIHIFFAVSGFIFGLAAIFFDWGLIHIIIQSISFILNLYAAKNIIEKVDISL